MVCLNCFKYKLGKRKIEFMYYNFEYVKIFIIMDFFIKDKWCCFYKFNVLINFDKIGC